MIGDQLAHSYRTCDVPVPGGSLRVGVWEPTGVSDPPAVLAVHGITASHVCWELLAAALPNTKIIAPDLRGRGRSNALPGPTGMRVHANDLVGVLDAFELDTAPVIGHSMGGFVSVVLAHQHSERVSQLVLIDGGLPLEVPAGLTSEQLIAAILGPAAERLNQRWASVEEYAETVWRPHPAFRNDWSEALDHYLAYDLVPDGDLFRPSTSYATVVADTTDLVTGTDLAVAAADLRHRTLFVTVPRGLQAEPPGLYPAELRDRMLTGQSKVTHVELNDLNHYTVVLSDRGAQALAPLILRECQLS